MLETKGCVDYLPTILLLLAISFVTNWIGYKKAFYTLPLNLKKPAIPLLQILGCFAIYFIAFLPLAHFFFKAAHVYFPTYKETSIFAIAQIASTILCFFFSGYFLVFSKKRTSFLFGKTAITVLPSP